jgi:hypothetical protein
MYFQNPRHAPVYGAVELGSPALVAAAAALASNWARRKINAEKEITRLNIKIQEFQAKKKNAKNDRQKRRFQKKIDKFRSLLKKAKAEYEYSKKKQSEKEGLPYVQTFTDVVIPAVSEPISDQGFDLALAEAEADLESEVAFASGAASPGMSIGKIAIGLSLLGVAGFIAYKYLPDEE